MSLKNVTRDFIALLEDAEAEFTFNGVAYPCVLKSQILGKQYDLGGFENEYGFGFATSLKKIDSNDRLVDRFTTEPALGDKVTISSVEYRISKIEKDIFTGFINAQLQET